MKPLDLPLVMPLGFGMDSFRRAADAYAAATTRKVPAPTSFPRFERLRPPGPGDDRLVNWQDQPKSPWWWAD
jgi:hypothetical protein